MALDPARHRDSVRQTPRIAPLYRLYVWPWSTRLLRTDKQSYPLLPPPHPPRPPIHPPGGALAAGWEPVCAILRPPHARTRATIGHPHMERARDAVGQRLVDQDRAPWCPATSRVRSAAHGAFAEHEGCPKGAVGTAYGIKAWLGR